MVARPVGDKLLMQAVELYEELGSNAKVGVELDRDEATIRRWRKEAARRGLDGSVPFPAPQGFRVKESTVSYDKKGGKTTQSVKFTEESGDVFEVAKGHTVKGVSSLVDADGRVKQQWVKTDARGRATEDIIEDMKRAALKLPTKAPSIIRPKDVEEELSVYIMTDWHLGMWASADETGQDWDLATAKEVLQKTFFNMISATRKTEKALVLGLGDLMHADNFNNQTGKSKNPLDVDGRYGSVFDTAVEVISNCIMGVAQNHQDVTVKLLPGNHDEHSTIGLAHTMYGWFRESNRIDVNISKNPTYYHPRYGVNIVGGTHADKLPLKKCPTTMMIDCRADMPHIKTAHFHTGHIHHESTVEEGGVVAYAHRAPIPGDAYHAARFRSAQSMKRFNYGKNTGRVGILEEPIAWKG